jgi:hypothetical protein
VPRFSTAMVLRHQLGSIADEVVGKLQLSSGSAVYVAVQPYTGKELAENAFAEALQNRGFRPLMKMTSDTGATTLKVSVLNDRAQFREINQKTSERIVQTDLEVRVENAKGESLASLGMFHRIGVDTVGAKDIEVIAPHQGSEVDEDTTFFQRFVGPLIVLASGIIVVYLFFTVRS